MATPITARNLEILRDAAFEMPSRALLVTLARFCAKKIAGSLKQ
jgi:hypothetical protein